jgi:hypothetical protein
MSSAQSRGARHRSAMAKQQVKGFIAPLNFLLTCSDSTLDTYELARLSEIANLRAEMHEIFDRLLDTSNQAALARWFRAQDRQALKHAIENEESPVEWANRKIREGQRNGEELLPLPSLPPGDAHLAAALRYQERNVAEGKCAICPQPLAPNSVRYCEKHLTKARLSHEPKGAKGAQPGSIGWLHGDMFQSGHGRQPGSLATLEMNREKKTRAVLAELGIPPESAAVSLKAAKDALWRVMPQSKAKAVPMSELFEAAVVPSRTTGQKALAELLSEGKIQRAGKGGPRDLFRYHAAVRRDCK